MVVSVHTDLHLGLDPGPDDIGLVGELSAQSLVVLLPGVFLDQSLVALRHQLPDLRTDRRVTDMFMHISVTLMRSRE